MLIYIYSVIIFCDLYNILTIHVVNKILKIDIFVLLFLFLHCAYIIAFLLMVYIYIRKRKLTMVDT